MMVTHSIHQETKYTDEFHFPNLVCTGFDPVISRGEKLSQTCPTYVPGGRGREGSAGGTERERVSGRRKTLPSLSATCA